ncbi:MAG: ABC transporter substrate-binding protein [Sulfuricurvum sp.]
MRRIVLLLFCVICLHANERIISLSPSITEILFALGKGEEIVGTSAYSLYPKEAQNIPVVGGYETPNLEKIIALRPTLVFGQSYIQSTLTKLEHFGIRTVALEFKTIADIKTSIQTIAKSVHANDANLTRTIDDALLHAKKNTRSHSVMIVYGLHEDLRSGIYIAGKNIFFDDIIMACGNTNAYTQSLPAQPRLSYENVIALNPEQIIILHSRASNPNVDEQKALEAWHDIPTEASKNKRISIVDEPYIHIPSHRVALSIERLCREMER